MKINYNILGFRKILIGFVVIVVIALLNVIFTSGIVQQNKAIISRITTVLNPYLEKLDELHLLLNKSKMLSTNWIYLGHNDVDKQSLIRLQEIEFPALRIKLTELGKYYGGKKELDSVKAIFKRFEKLIAFEKMIMVKLAEFEEYNIPQRKFEAENILEEEVLPRSDELILYVVKTIQSKREEADIMRSQILLSFNRLFLIILLTGFGLLIIVFIAAAYISRSITKPVSMMREIILGLSRGELFYGKISNSNDIVGEMQQSVKKLTESFKKTSTFANEIGKGNLGVEYQPLSENDILGNSLLEMQKNLQVYSENLEHLVEERTKQLREEKEKVQTINDTLNAANFEINFQKKEIENKNAKLETAYKDVRDSIIYAKRIQEAISPDIELVSDVLPDSFIFLRPKDIVSGDFYWFTKKGNEVIIAAVDCTGHGVPGALMTVIGHSLLHQIINLENIHDPAEILTHLDKKILETLQRQTGSQETNDGMDIAICNYNLDTKKLLFGGAKRSMLLFRKNVCEEIAADKFPIGSFQYDFKKKFSTHQFDISKNDSVYIFTDGYQDQFGIKGKKFLKKHFREMLKTIQEKAMKEQAKHLEKTFDDWRGNMEQTDDVLVIGLRF